jgi:hypothetical protein
MIDLRQLVVPGGQISVSIQPIYLGYSQNFCESNMNSDPGCAVDIPAVFYSLSFAPNPEFSKVFPSQAEMVNPNTFNILGVDTFEGDIIHTASWKADTSLHQKDVIVVGNGCKLCRHLLFSLEAIG